MSWAKDALQDFLLRYDSAKGALEQMLGASEALLHVHFGLLIFVVAALVTRRRMASIAPLAIVVVLAGLNEVLDYLGPDPASPWLSAADFANSVFWPTVLFLIARRGSFRTKV